MKKVLLVFTSMLAALVAGAVFVGSASASTVGEVVCSVPDFCGEGNNPLNLDDWDGFAGEPGNEGSSEDGGYHCNNVFFEGTSGETTGTRDGTAYYTVGRNPALDPDAEFDDCDQSGSKDLTNDSIVLLRGVGYLNSPTLGPQASQPGCDVNENRNPGCPDGDEEGKSAGYIGVGRGNEPVIGNVDAGGKGNLP